jgi:hypothetical protein
MDINSAFPSKFLKASDLNGRSSIVTMERVEIDKMQDGNAKPVLYFAGKTKGLVLNKTNSNKIASMYGTNTEDWEGGQIEIFPAEVEFQGQMVKAIRVRAVNKSRPAQRAPQTLGAPTPAAAYNERNPTAAVAYNDRNPPPQEILDDEIPW